MHYVLAVGEDDDIAFLEEAFRAQPGRIQVTSTKKGVNLWSFITGCSPAEVPFLIIIDQQLPDIDSHALLLRLKADKRLKLIPIAMMSGFVTEELIREYYRAGANCFYKKPVDPADWNHMAECLLTLFYTRY